MKKIYLYLTAVILILAAGLSVTGCDDSNSAGGSTEIAVTHFFPAKVFEGQEVQISGTRLNEATAVVFPDGKSVTALKKTGTGLITVTTPAGVTSGILSVQAGGNTVSSNVQLTVGNPRIKALMPENQARIGQELIITGFDMEFYTKIKFPGKTGDIVVNSTEFNRKSSDFIYVKVPAGIAIGPTRIKLVVTSGREDLLPEINLVEQ